MKLDWKETSKNIPKTPYMGLGWSNHLLLYSKKNKCWFEGFYHFDSGEYFTIDHQSLEEYKISHFCEEIPTP